MSYAITDVITAFNTKLRATGVFGRVYDSPPDAAPSNSGDLPCAIPIIQSATGRYQAQNYYRKEYQLEYLLLIQPYSGKLATIDARALTIVDPVLEIGQNVKLGDPTITHLGTGVEDAPLISLDYGPLVWAGVDYIGFTLSFGVTIKRSLVAVV